MTKRAFYRLVWILSALAIVGMSVYFPLQPEAAATVGPMVSYTTEDKTLSFVCPDNWKPNETTQNGTDTAVVFVPRSQVRFVIHATLKDALLSDVGQSGNAGLGSLPGLPATGTSKDPVETIHALQKDRMERDTDSYPAFADGSTRKIRIAGVEGLETPFTYQKRGDFFQKETESGKRISALVAGRGLSVVETYPPALEKEVQPVFDKILASLNVKDSGG